MARRRALRAGWPGTRVLKSAVAAGRLRPVLPDHVCESLNVHALLPTRQFVPAKVRCFLDALEVHAHGSAAQETEPLPG